MIHQHHIGRAHEHTSAVFVVTCLDLPYHCDINTQTAQRQLGVIIVFKLLRHTGNASIFDTHM